MGRGTQGWVCYAAVPQTVPVRALTALSTGQEILPDSENQLSHYSWQEQVGLVHLCESTFNQKMPPGFCLADAKSQTSSWEV